MFHKPLRMGHTFFNKMEAKDQGCGLSIETSVVGVLKAYKDERN